MCLAIPGKIISIKGDQAKIDFMGVSKEANISLVNFKPQKNDYVLVHAGFVIQKLLKEDALASIKRYEEISRAIN